MISAVEWVPAGVADPSPKKYEFSPAELELIQLMEEHNMQDLHEVQAHLEKEQKEKEENDEEERAAVNKKNKKEKKKNKPVVENTLPADLRMDEYSSDEDDNEAFVGKAVGRLLVNDDEGTDDMEEEEDVDGDGQVNKSSSWMDHSDHDESDDDDDDLDDVPDTREYTPVDLEGLKAIGLSQVGTNAPAYMDEYESDDDENDSEAEDVMIRPDDAIVVVAKTEEDFASLEVHVYEQDTGNLFVHHDIPLPAFPLCLAHGDISPTGTAGNFCAVGTFGPGIEVWNLDVLNALEPSCVLGGEDTSIADEIMRHNILNKSLSRQPKPLKQRGSSLKPGSHTDAVMSISWNKIHRQVIASGSADCTVKLWDITQARSGEANASTLKHHKDKVQSVLWHPKEGTLLATGSYDRTVALVDARNAENLKRAKIPGDCESLAWDPFNPQHLTAASEDGTVTCWDVRQFSDKTPLWSFVASEFGGVSDMSYNPLVPGMLATCSVDKTVTLWDTLNNPSDTVGPPRIKLNKDMKVGKLYTLNFYPSSPWLLACAGGAKELALWDMTRDDIVQKCFGGRTLEKAATNETTTTKSTLDDASNKVALDAMMSSSTSGKLEHNPTKEPASKKKDKGKKKKKVHRARR